jgi:hypothetical protein
LRLDFKELEDALGRVDYHHDLRDRAKLEGRHDRVFGYFTGANHAELQNLTTRLHEGGWLVGEAESGRVAQIRRAIEKLDWAKDKKERKRLGTYLIDRLGKLDEKSQALDFDSLEQGIHEFRRVVRWLMIYPRALRGAVRFIDYDAPAEDLQMYLTDGLRDSPFIRFDADPRESHPIEISAGLLFAFTTVISQIGDLKDAGQWEDGIEIARKRTGLAKPKKANAVRKKLPKQVREIVKQFVEEHRVPQRMAEEIRKQL